MKKIILALALISSLAFGSAPKHTSCDLSQIGDVTLNLGGYGVFKKANYQAIAETGKNFKAIFIGSTISVKSATLTITDIQADRRIKGKPRTGVITVSLNADNITQKIEMNYSYDKGDFSAKGVQKNGKNISFALKIKALLCSSK